MNLHKIAQKFAFKLAAGENAVKSQVRKVYELGMKLTNANIISLWLNASDLDGGYEEIITDPLYAIRKIVQKYYSDMNRFGLTKQTNIDYLSQLKEQISEIEKIKLDKPLDPHASNIFDEFRKEVDSVLPVEVPGSRTQSQRAPINLPEQTIDNIDNDDFGASYNDTSSRSTPNSFSLRDQDRWND